ncbi:MAG: hypothetical protein MUF64_06710 [Polyangiaceae bacterium]|jgi:hypothetical protein|nr:hypothetical protein [Polyangiaceae bacterium]
MDAFCAVSLVLGATPAEIEEALGARPGWLDRYQGAAGSQGRAAQLAPRLLALRLAAERGRLTWG